MSHTNKGACATFQHRAKYGRRERVKAKKPGGERANPCNCPGKDHKTDGACDTWRWRHKDQVVESPPAAAPAPVPADLQAKAERQVEREKKREAERQKKREQRAEAQRIENAQHEDVCLYDLSEGHMTLEDCKRMYPSMYNKDGSMK